jgi:hypothetical protein
MIGQGASDSDVSVDQNGRLINAGKDPQRLLELNLDSPTQFVGEGGSQHTNALLSWDDVTCRRSTSTTQKGIRWMRLSHACRAISARFDDPNLVSCAGLVPVMALAQRCRLDSCSLSWLGCGVVGRLRGCGAADRA